MAKIDFTAKLMQIDGKAPIQQEKKDKDAEGKPVSTMVDLTLEEVCTQALLTPYQDETAITGEEKAQRYQIAKTIARTAAGETTVLKSEDILAIKKLLPKLYAPLIVGQAFDLLEGAE